MAFIIFINLIKEKHINMVSLLLSVFDNCEILCMRLNDGLVAANHPHTTESFNSSACSYASAEVLTPVQWFSHTQG